MCSISVSDDLAPRYLEILNSDANIFALSLHDAFQSESIMQRYIFRFKIYKNQAQIFESLFVQSDLPVVENAAKYLDFRSQLKKHIILIEKVLSYKHFSKNAVEEIYQSAYQLDDYYYALTGK